MQNPLVSPKSLLFPSHSFRQFIQFFNIIVLIDTLAAGNTPCHYNTLDIEDNNQKVCELRKTHATSFSSWRVWWLPVQYHFVSALYLNNQAQSQANADFNKSGSLRVRCKIQNKFPVEFLVQLIAFLEPFLCRPFPCTVLLKCVKRIHCLIYPSQLLL